MEFRVLVQALCLTFNTVINEIIPVQDEAAFFTARDLAKTEGLLVGISSGTAVFATAELAARAENQGKDDSCAAAKQWGTLLVYGIISLNIKNIKWRVSA